MLALHCTACARYAPVSDDDERLILRWRLTCETFGSGPDREADLCPRCLARLLARYFGVEPEPLTEELRAREALLGPPSLPDHLFADDPLAVA